MFKHQIDANSLRTETSASAQRAKTAVELARRELAIELLAELRGIYMQLGEAEKARIRVQLRQQRQQ
jgi:hypothetical protein